MTHLTDLERQNEQQQEVQGTQNQTRHVVRAVAAALAGLPIALIYGVLARWAFSAPDDSGVLSAMTCGFLFLVPVAMGALTIVLAPMRYRRSSKYVFFMPWVSVLITVLAIALLGMEAIICIVMALPILLLLASLGGMIFRVRAKADAPSVASQVSLVGVLLLAPYGVTPLETSLPNPDAIYRVDNQIVIDANVDTVWRNIIEVPMIQPAEQRFSLFHSLGLPKPLEATLSYEGVGGIRRGYFEGGLVFIEEVTAWHEHERVNFTIQRDRQRRVSAMLNEIGGRYFDMIDGTYRIEQRQDGTLILHLSSRHRLSTRFDFYGSIWTRWVMWDLQNDILQIIKVRCEAGV